MVGLSSGLGLGLGLLSESVVIIVTKFGPSTDEAISNSICSDAFAYGFKMRVRVWADWVVGERSRSRGSILLSYYSPVSQTTIDRRCLGDSWPGLVVGFEMLSELKGAKFDDQGRNGRVSGVLGWLTQY